MSFASVLLLQKGCSRRECKTGKQLMCVTSWAGSEYEPDSASNERTVCLGRSWDRDGDGEGWPVQFWFFKTASFVSVGPPEAEDKTGQNWQFCVSFAKTFSVLRRITFFSFASVLLQFCYREDPYCQIPIDSKMIMATLPRRVLTMIRRTVWMVN